MNHRQAQLNPRLAVEECGFVNLLRDSRQRGGQKENVYPDVFPDEQKIQRKYSEKSSRSDISDGAEYVCEPNIDCHINIMLAEGRR